MNEAIANACLIVGSRFKGANQMTTGTMTQKNRPMKVRQEVLAGADGALIVPALSSQSATTSLAICGGVVCACFANAGSPARACRVWHPPAVQGFSTFLPLLLAAHIRDVYSPGPAL